VGDHTSGAITGQSTDGFIAVNRKKRKQPELVGTSNTAGVCPLKTAKRTAHVYIGRLDSEVTTDTLSDYIKSLTDVEEEELDIEKLNTKSTNSSFRVSLPMEKLSAIKKSELWNEGTILGRYFFPRQNFQNPQSIIKNQ
jgi:hypothetical protein